MTKKKKYLVIVEVVMNVSATDTDDAKIAALTSVKLDALADVEVIQKAVAKCKAR